MKKNAKVTVQESAEQTVEQLIYVGPDIKNVIKKYTVYNNGIPTIVKDAIEKVPVIKKLIIPVDKLKSVNEKLNEDGSAYNIFYRQIEENIKGGQ